MGTIVRLSLKSKVPQVVPKVVDELQFIRTLRGEARLVAFLQQHDPERVADAAGMLKFGGCSEVEMWDKLQIRYQVNQRRRLLNSLKACEPDSSSHLWHRNVDGYLADCETGEEVEELIAKHTEYAMKFIERKNNIAAKEEMTWDKGNTNSYQQVPPTELND